MRENQNNGGSTRREFLQKTAVTTAVGVAAASSMPTTAEAMRRVIGANERINIAHVGVGVQGNTHVRLLKEHKATNNTESVAIADLYVRARKEVGKDIGLKEENLYGDFRKMLEKQKEIDAVWVATSDNWHADVAVACLEAGKHVYVEKPMCRSVKEAFHIYDAVKKSGKKLQVGSQGCSDAKWHTARKVVADGKIGHVVMAQGSYMRNGRDGEWNNYGRFDTDAGPTASGDAFVDWETFRKGRGTKEWNPDIFFRWRKWFDFGSGLVGDLFPHRLHPLFLAMNLPTSGLEGFPMRVSSGGGLYVQKVNPKTQKPDRNVPDFTNITIDYGEKFGTMMAISSTINEEGWQDSIRGNKATLYFGGAGVEIKPERVWSDEVEAGIEPVVGPGEDIAVHEKNFLDCIRDGKEPNCNIEVAVRVQVGISLAEMSYRQNKTFTFDPATRSYKS